MTDFLPFLPAVLFAVILLAFGFLWEWREQRHLRQGFGGPRSFSESGGPAPTGEMLRALARRLVPADCRLPLPTAD